MSPTAHAYIQKLQLIYAAVLITLVTLNVVAYFVRATGPSEMDPNYWLYILAVLLAVAGTASMMIFRIMLRKAQDQPTLQDKLNKYSVASISRLALIETAGLFAAVVVIVTGNLQAYVVSVIAVLMILMSRPTMASLNEDLMLSAEERAQVEKG